jgi:hypothetical protein
MRESLEKPHPGAIFTKLLAALQTSESFVRTDPRAQTPLLQAEASRYVMRVLDGMLLTGLAIADPDYPRLVRLFDTYRHSGNANPDCVYLYARISAAHSYRITGKRGTSRLVEVQTMDGDFIAGPNHKGLVTLTDLAADADGNIEIILSATPHDGNWVRLDEAARWLYLRQYYYDWETEVPASLTIEREGALLPPPSLPPEELAARLERIVGFVPSWFRHLANFAGRYYDAPADALNFVPSPSGMAGLLYGKGHFELGADQALVLEFLPPESPYWSFQIMNHFWEALDFDVRQTSLNGHQAQLDPEGMFRAVISLTDPGVPNWLDPCGHPNGLICCRILRPAHQPAVSLRVVPLDQLRQALHPDTPHIAPQQRHASLRRRMLGFQRRFRE